jgi:phosphoribosyl-AMP cyclohydrolase / phosphoribosyl-ATP pyrophosphohydrolase
VPVIIQDSETQVVLMLGYMNEEAYNKTVADGKVCFFSRSKNRLWVKGETSQNYLIVKDIKLDCDNDTILIKAIPQGPTCHTGAATCFNEENTAISFLPKLAHVIAQRAQEGNEKSYTNQLLNKGINKVAQKVGEEAVELVIEAKDNNKDLFLGEAADLMYHFLVLLQAKQISLQEVEAVLASRHQPQP